MKPLNENDKQLLLKDLCSRLPYKPKIKVSSVWNEDKEVEEDIVDTVYCVMPDGYINTETIDSDISLDDIVLYLRPMSSMTRAEVLEYISLKESIVASDGITYFFETYKSIDWLNKKMFDYRKDDEGKTMIEKGLALEAPEGMYN